MFIKERVSYLKGLADGMKIEESTNEGRLLKAIIEVLDDIADEIDYLQEVQDEMSEHIDSIDEDLAELESYVYEDYEDEDGDIEEDEDDAYIGEIECPHCKEKIDVYEDMLDDDNTLRCPECGGEIEIDEEGCCCEDYDDYSDNGEE